MLRKNLTIIFISPLLGVSLFFCAHSLWAQEDSDGQSVFREQRSREGYTLNLRDLIEESRNKISKVDEELKAQAQRRRNQQREEKAREYYDKAMRLFDEGNLNEAQVYWERAIKITEHPEMKNYVRESIRREKAKEVALEKEQDKWLKRLEIERGYTVDEVESTYQEAIKLYKMKNYFEALQSFENVEEMFPDHKATRSYLMLVQQEILKEQEEIIRQKVQEEAEARRKEKEIWRKKLEAEDKARKSLLRERADEVYGEAVRLYKNGRFVQSKEKFQDVEWMISDYKSTLWYLARLEKDIEKENVQIRKEDEIFLQDAEPSIEEIVSLHEQMTPAERQSKATLDHKKSLEQRSLDEAEFVYSAAVKLFEQGELDKAYVKFQDVEYLVSGYGQTHQYLAKLQSRLQKGKAEDLYKEGILFYKQKKYEEAKIVFEELKRLSPGYRRVNRYLTKTNRKIIQNRKDTSPAGFADAQVNSSDGMGQETIADSSAVNDIVQSLVDERTRQFQEEAEEKYRLALDFYKNENYTEAKIRFIQVEALIPGYKKNHEFLESIDQKIAKQSFQRQLIQGSPQLIKAVPPLVVNKGNENLVNAEMNPAIRRAVELYNQKFFTEARTAFMEIQKNNPSDRDAKMYLAKIDNIFKQREKIRIKAARDAEKFAREEFDALLKLRAGEEASELKEMVVAELDSNGKDEYYLEGVKWYQQGDLKKAQARFEQLASDFPGYRLTEWYLGCIDQELNGSGKDADDRCVPENDFIALSKSKDSALINSKIDSDVPVWGGGEDFVSEMKDKYVMKSKSPVDWEKSRDENYARYKANEAYLEKIKRKQYRDFRREIEQEKRRYEVVEQERQRIIERQKKNTRERLEQEDMDRIRDEREQVRLAEQEKRLAEKKAFEAEQKILKERKGQEKIELEKIRNEKKMLEDEMSGLEVEQKIVKDDFQSELDSLRAKLDKIQNDFDKKLKSKDQKIKELQGIIDNQSQLETEVATASKVRQEHKNQISDIVKEEIDPVVEIASIQEESEWKDESARSKARQQLTQAQKDREHLEAQKEADLRKQRAEVKNYLSRLREDQKAKIRDEVADIYQEALDLYQNDRLLEARIKFNSVENLYPGFWSAEAYISKIDKKINRERERYTDKLVELTVAEQKAQFYQKDLDARLETVKEEAAIQARDEVERQRVLWEAQQEKERKARENQSKKIQKKQAKVQKQELKKNLEIVKSDVIVDSSVSEKDIFLKDESMPNEAKDVKDVKDVKEAQRQERLRALEEKERRRQQILETKRQEKEMAVLAKRKAVEEKKNFKLKQKQLKKDIDLLAEEVLNLYSQGPSTLADEKFAEFDRLLMSGGFSESYVNSKRKHLGKRKARIDKQLALRKENESLNTQEISESVGSQQMVSSDSQKAVESLSIENNPVVKLKDTVILPQENVVVDVQIPEDLKELKKKIRSEEKRLSKQKALQERRIEELKQHEAQLARRDVMREQLRQERLERQAEREQQQLRMEQLKRERIELLEKQRQESLLLSKQEKSEDLLEDEGSEETVVSESIIKADRPQVNASLTASEEARQKLENIDRKRKTMVSSEQLAMEKQLRLEEAKRITRDERRELERRRREDLQRTLEERQKEIQKEREQIQKDLERNLDRLYVKAVGLYKQRDYSASYEIFQEINRMKPVYKKTQRYLDLIRKKTPNVETSPNAVSARLSAEVITAKEKLQPVSSRLSVIREALDQLESR